MDYLINKKVAQPTSEIDWNVAIKIISTTIGGLIAWIYFINAYFKNKSKEKEDWIKKIAESAVSAAMDKTLTDVREDIQTLFRYREADRKHIDEKFDNILREIKK